MTRLSRHGVILDLIKQGPVANQDDMRRELGKRGFRVTQATLSRDIHRLGLVKMPQGYTLPQNAAAAAAQPAVYGVDRLFREFVREVREAQNLLVVKTAVGSAQPVAAALDGEQWPEVVGTIAGDDAILIVTPSNKSAQKLEQKIRGLLAK